MSEIPDIPGVPDTPTHAVPMDAPTSPEWAKQKLWEPIIGKLCKPCKEQKLPVLGEQFLALRNTGDLAVGNLTVHCPDKNCRYYAGDYSPNQWNDLMR